MSFSGSASVKEIHTEAELQLRRCGRELGQVESHNYSGGCDQMYLLTRILGPLAIIYAWTSTSQSGQPICVAMAILYVKLQCPLSPDAEEGFRRLAALLRAFTSKPVVIVTSFRIAILDSFVTLSLRRPQLVG